MRFESEKEVMVFLLLLTLQGANAAFRIMSSSPANGSLAREGEAAVLTCSTDSPWFLCQWLSPRGSKSCLIRGKGQVCEGVRVASQIEGDNTSCSLSLRGVDAKDRGGWTCLLQDGDTLTSDTRTIALDVAIQAKLQIEVRGEDSSSGVGSPLGWGNGYTKEGNMLSVVEGQQVEVACVVEGANPRGEVEWRGPKDSSFLPSDQQNRGLFGSQQYGNQYSDQSYGSPGRVGVPTEDGWPQDVSLGRGREEDARRSQEDATFSSTSVLSYRALAWHNNRSLSCTVRQLSRDGGLIFTSTATLFLQVESLPASPDLYVGPGQDMVGMIVGIVIGVLVFIILIILTVVCLIRKRSHRKDTPDEAPVARTAPQQQAPKPQGPGVWVRLTSLIPKRAPAQANGAPSHKSKGPQRLGPGRGRTLSPIPGSVEGNGSRSGSRQSGMLNGSRNSLASASRHGSRTSVNTAQSVVNMAPPEQSDRSSTAVNMSPPEESGRNSPAYSVDETEML